MFWGHYSIIFVPNIDWLRVPVVQRSILDIIIPVKRIEQLSYIYYEKKSVTTWNIFDV